MKISEIQALIRLLEDPDPEIHSQIQKRIVQCGLDIIPFLEDHRSDSANDVDFLKRIEQCICRIRSQDVLQEMENWLMNDERDILDAAIMIARMQYPEVDGQEVRDFMSKLRQEVWLELNDNLTAFEKVKVINHFLYNEYGFCGNQEAYHDADNSMINRVIETRTGNPLLMSVIYMSLARSLEIPISGINLPNHFVVAYMEDEFLAEEGISLTDNGVLFYVNPFGQGAILHRTEIDNFLTHLDINPQERFLKPCTEVDMVKRMLNNLILSYTRDDKVEYLDQVRRILQLMQPVVTK